MNTIGLCGVTALFDIILKTNKHQDLTRLWPHGSLALVGAREKLYKFSIPAFLLDVITLKKNVAIYSVMDRVLHYWLLCSSDRLGAEAYYQSALRCWLSGLHDLLISFLRYEVPDKVLYVNILASPAIVIGCHFCLCEL